MTIKFEPWDTRPEFAEWKTSVQVAVEADDFAHHTLWGHWSRAGVDFWRRVDHGHVVEQVGRPHVDRIAGVDVVRVEWEQGRAGTGAQIQGRVETFVSLNVDKLDGIPVLFYWATSVLVDHDAVASFVRKTFVGAHGRHHDANNFHNAIHDIRALNQHR